MPESATRTYRPPQDEVVDICRDLIRIDSSNYGDGSGPGERAAAEHVAGLLSEVGLEPEIFESADRRTSLVVRWEGEDTSRPGLLVHGHLDVVPAEARDWTHDPFAGELADGCVWGRGAIDMKDMDAMVLAVVRQWRREGRKPPRDVVLCFLADEEAGGKFGAHWMVDNHPGQFEGVSEAISEVGGFSFSIGNERIYLIETAQKGIRWLRLVAEGRAGHGSMVNDDNAVTALAEAVARIGRHEWPLRMTPTVQRFLEEMSDALGIELDLADPESGPGQARRPGPHRRRDAAQHGQPDDAQGRLQAQRHPAVGRGDGRLPLPARLRGRAARDDRRADRPGRTARGGHHRHRAGDHLRRPPRRRDGGGAAGRGPGLAGGALLPLGRHRQQVLQPAGHPRLRLRAARGCRPTWTSPAMFHGVDERVPVDSLQFGTRVLDRFLATS